MADLEMTKGRKGHIELGDITQHNVNQLKRLNQVIFPVTYNNNFYKDVLEVGSLAQLAYYNDIVVGGVCCRVDKSQDGQKKLYIMTLGCLAPYRRLGIGTVMVEHVLGICEKDGTYNSVYLHVQVNNDDAIEFYKKFDFEVTEKRENYYKRIEPPDAYVLEKKFRTN
ncbi:DgyrCDS14099 [Dimorphilus gyrociliatus]|uniref:N-terminal methionine N(alpha)-acetyltransferase NatE n=1 Tax=Dimorphilus gyrociliatus TaxID=2664684 RepID=A0A7I8WCP4_9ANNE|nr:DgyrCDS14099 [Dimorphilus gyrociliatus]